MRTARLVCSSSHAALLEEARAVLGRPEVLVLAATRGAADDLIRSTTGEGALGAHRVTLPQLAADLATRPMAERGFSPVSMLGLEALAAKVAHGMWTERRFAYFQPVADTPGFAIALARTLTELRLEQVDPAALAATGLPGADLAELLRRYDRDLREAKLADLALLLSFALDVIGAGRHRFLRLPLVLLGVRADYGLQRQFLAALSRQSPEVLATALEDDEAAIGALSEALGVHPERVGPGEVRQLHRIRSQLFAAEVEAPAAPDQSLEIFSAPGEGIECVEIARRIHALAAEGVPFDRIGVALRAPERYQTLLEEAFRRAGIPGYFTRGSARPDPAGRAFLALLGCAADGLSASRFAEYLSLGQAPAVALAPAETPFVPSTDEILGGAGTAIALEPDEDEQKVEAPVGWEQLLVDAAVIGGKERWQKRLDGLESELRLRLGAMEEDDARRESVERQLERLGRLERFALPVIAMLAELPESAPWSMWLDLMKRLASATLRRPEPVQSVLSELEPMGEIGPVTLGEVQGVLSERLGMLRLEPPARRYGSVWVGSIEETRGRSFPVVFLPGLAEGLFPRRVFEDPLLLDEYRQTLGLTVRSDRATDERLLLQTASAAASERLVVSYPRMDVAQARPRVPSFYALEFARVASGRLPDLRRFEEESARRASATLGWPAPKDAMEAIDDAEFDLAYLQPVLGQKVSAKGRGHYLTEVNEHLVRSLRARWRRWNKAWHGDDGLVLEQDASAATLLERHRLNARPYSASALQHYTGCPYRFFLSAIQRLEPREEPAAIEQLDPLTRGQLFHRVQFETFLRLKEATLLPVAMESLAAARELADAALDEVAGRFADKLAPAIPRVWQGEIEDIRADLHGWLQHVSLHAGGWKPTHFEFAFGLDDREGRDPRSRTDPAAILEGRRLRGSIDLIEESPGRGTIRVTDHKTGKPPEKNVVSIGGGAYLQPVLYALAAESMLGRTVENGRLFFCTQRGHYQETTVPLNDRTRGDVAQFVEILDEAIRGGFLPAAPRAGECARCDYRIVCGPYEEQRVKRKPKERIEELEYLRRMP